MQSRKGWQAFLRIVASAQLVVAIAMGVCAQPPKVPFPGGRLDRIKAGLGATEEAGSSQENSAAGVGNEANTEPSGQNPPSAGSTLREQVTQRAQEVGKDTEREAEVKTLLNEMYQQTLKDLDSIQGSLKSQIEFDGRANVAEKTMADAKREKELFEQQKELAKAQADEEPEFITLDEGTRQLDALQAELSNLSTERARLTKEQAEREKRIKELPTLISDAKAKLEALAPADATANSEDPLVVEAQSWSLDSRRQALESQIAALEAENRLYQAENGVLPIQLETVEGREKLLLESQQELAERVKRLKEDRILLRKSEVQTLVRQLPEEWQERGAGVLERIDEWYKLSSKHAEVKKEIQETEKVVSEWNEKRQKMESRVNPGPGAGDAFGFNSWVGLTLRKQRDELPDPDRLDARIRYLQDEMQSADSLLFEIDDAADELERAKDDEASEVQPLISKSAEILQSMRQDVNAYLGDLYTAADKKVQARKLSDSYRNFIDRHVLWLRSSEQLKLSDYADGLEGFRWLVSFANWKQLGSSLLADGKRYLPIYLIFIVLLGGLIYQQASLRRRIGNMGATAERTNCDDFSLTIKTLLCTILISIPAPLVLVFLVWRISSAVEFESGQSSLTSEVLEFQSAFAAGLLSAATIFAPMELLRQTCRLHGLGIQHFDWEPNVTRSLALNLRWLIDLAIPLTVVVTMFAVQSESRWDASLGRLGFIATMPLLSVFQARVFAPRNGVLTHVIEQRPGGWLDRLRYVWYAVLAFYPIGLAVISFIGFHYTAIRIAVHFNTTLWMVVVLVTVFYLLKRWLVLSRRELVRDRARARLEAAARGETNQESSTEEEIDLDSLSDQTKRLVASIVVTTGLVLAYFIWSDVIPAVSFLDDFELWTVEGKTAEETVRITLANVVWLIPVVILTAIAGRNVPGLLEIALLQHLPLTTAARYAITTISRYVIVGIGITATGLTLGLKWDSIQWLVAALGVGLGFGLQEIFANFVSGVILLFEQPIRVGDVITIDGTTGSVSKIRMRATTIVNWDRQELIVPNKDLITGKLLNWTLTDTTNRIVLEIGVAYGSDIAQVSKIIRDVCTEHKNVMKDPQPIVTFDGFGDSSLNLTLRAFLDSLDCRLSTIHELHDQIYRAFADAGIEIPFPQRDLNLRSVPDDMKTIDVKKLGS